METAIIIILAVICFIYHVQLRKAKHDIWVREKVAQAYYIRLAMLDPEHPDYERMQYEMQQAA